MHCVREGIYKTQLSVKTNKNTLSETFRCKYLYTKYKILYNDVANGLVFEF